MALGRRHGLTDSEERGPLGPQALAIGSTPHVLSRSSFSFSTTAAVEGALAATGFGVFVVWAWRDGGFAPEEWLPGGLLLLALLCTAAVSSDVRARLAARRLPLGLFALYVVWSFLSMSWAHVPADALDGANRTLVYWLVFALFTGLGISEWLGGVIVGAWGAALAALGLIVLLQTGISTTAADHFVQGRLAAPLSYPDGGAALFLSACLALVVLASRPRAGAAARIAACAAAAVLADLAVLCQSRGSLIWFPCAAALYVVIARRRLRAFAQLALLAAAVAPAAPALLRVYSQVVSGQDRRAPVMHAVTWIAGTAVLAVVAMAAVLLFERHVTVSNRARVLIATSLTVCAGAALVAAATVTVGSHPLARAERAWHNFTTDHASPPPRTLHFASGLGTSRYDVWRIAVREFLAHPITGVGSDNYLVGYLRQRRTHETSRYPMSVELRAFSETGIVGAALFLGFLGLALADCVRAARRSATPSLALACFAAFSYWLLHSSTDWFWELPALTGPALALLAIASAPTAHEISGRGRRQLSSRSSAIGAVAALITVGALAIPWASASLVDAALARGPSRSAYSLLGTASKLNPWSERPALVEATLAASAGDLRRERQALHQALRRNPFDWYPHFLLGIIAGREHRDTAARRQLALARRMSPEDLVILWAQRRLRWGLPLTQRQVGRVLRGS